MRGIEGISKLLRHVDGILLMDALGQMPQVRCPIHLYWKERTILYWNRLCSEDKSSMLKVILGCPNATSYMQTVLAEEHI